MVIRQEFGTWLDTSATTVAEFTMILLHCALHYLTANPNSKKKQRKCWRLSRYAESGHTWHRSLLYETIMILEHYIYYINTWYGVWYMTFSSESYVSCFIPENNRSPTNLKTRRGADLFHRPKRWAVRKSENKDLLRHHIGLSQGQSSPVWETRR